MRSAGRRITGMALWALALIVVPMPARAFELSGGVSLGGILVGTIPRLAVSPHAGISWKTEGGMEFVVRDAVSILPAVNRDGIGIYNQTSVAFGFAWKTVEISVGPSLSAYSMAACRRPLCGRVVGVAPGGRAQVTWIWR